MKALSLKQPWANLVASGEKTIETRRWRTPYRGLVAICSSMQPPIAPAGYWIATARIVDCRPMRIGDEPAAKCFIYPGAFAWVMEDIAKVTPVRVRGSLGLFELEPRLLR